jgi:hypothetical protein
MLLQHSSALRVGRHFPLAQQSAAFGDTIAPKQSYGVRSSRTAMIVTAMWIVRRTFPSPYQIGCTKRTAANHFQSLQAGIISWQVSHDELPTPRILEPYLIEDRLDVFTPHVPFAPAMLRAPDQILLLSAALLQETPISPLCSAP